MTTLSGICFQSGYCLACGTKIPTGHNCICDSCTREFGSHHEVVPATPAEAQYCEDCGCRLQGGTCTDCEAEDRAGPVAFDNGPREGECSCGRRLEDLRRPVCRRCDDAADEAADRYERRMVRQEENDE